MKLEKFDWLQQVQYPSSVFGPDKNKENQDPSSWYSLFGYDLYGFQPNLVNTTDPDSSETLKRCVLKMDSKWQ